MKPVARLGTCSHNGANRLTLAVNEIKKTLISAGGVITKIETLQTFEETLFANRNTKEKILETISQVVL
jgi:hypothetical protein